MTSGRLFLSLLLIYFIGIHQCLAVNVDSLKSVWTNRSLPDTVRLKAMESLAWDGYGYSLPDSAIFFADQMYRFADLRNLDVWKAKALNVQANALVVKGSYVKAYDKYLKSLEISQALHDKPGIAVTLHRIGIIYFYQGDQLRAIDYYSKSLAIREEIGDKKGISASVNNIGIVHSQLGHFDKALEFFRKSLDLCIELGDKRGEGSALNNIGLVYKATGELEEAFDYFTRSMQISESLKDQRDVAAALNNIGHIYELRGEYDEAARSFSRSIEIKRAVGDIQAVAISLINLGMVNNKQQKFSEAIENCLEGLSVAREIGALPEQKRACECLYINYKSLGKETEALKYHEQMLSLNDSLQNEETSRMLQKMEFARQMIADSLARVDERNKIQQAHQAEVRRKNRIRNIFAAVTGFLFIGAIALYNRIRFIRRSRAELAKEKERSDKLLLNILPEDVAQELKDKGEASALKYDGVSILFTDFVDFTRYASEMTPEMLVDELNECFKSFDSICEKYGLEKIKTIGDSYMAAGGLHIKSGDSVRNTIIAALELIEYMKKRKTDRENAGMRSFSMRVGVHTGPVVAGIVGLKKFQYDIWGDTVNTASRLESSGEEGKVNISRETYECIKNDPAFTFFHRGELMVKGKGCTEMYFVEYSAHHKPS